MKFLEGSDLTREMQRLVSETSNTKIAIAYWGADALKLLKLNPKRNDLQILCCLSGGKSAPEVIKQFGEQARQIDKLHAKVIWTPSEAIVGSANASSNGLPDEEKGIEGLIEAGAYLDDTEELASIKSWFDNLYENARLITNADLQAAEKAREKHPPNHQPKPELIDIPINKLRKMKVAVLLWSLQTTAQENRAIEKKLGEQSQAEWHWDSLTWYLDTLNHATKYPYGYEVLTFQTTKDRKRLLDYEGLQNFPLQTKWIKIPTSSSLNRVILAEHVEKADLARRSFKIGKASKTRIRALLDERKLKLRWHLDSGQGGLLSWEPLHELLTQSTAT
jgi:hypothetical protein